MLAEVEVSPPAVVVTAGCIGLRVELEGVLIRHRDARRRVIAEQRLLKRLADRLLAQLTDTRLQQIAKQELLQIGACEREAVPSQQFGQPLGDESLLAGVGE